MIHHGLIQPWFSFGRTQALQTYLSLSVKREFLPIKQEFQQGPLCKAIAKVTPQPWNHA